MGLYVDLTDEEKSVIEAWERNMRGFVNGLARNLNEARALQAAADASGGPREIVTGLDAGQEIPNSSGIAGAQDMTKQEWAAIVGILDAFITAHDTATVRQNFAKAAGPTAGLG